MDLSNNLLLLYLLRFWIPIAAPLSRTGIRWKICLKKNVGKEALAKKVGKKAECSLKVLQFCKVLCWLTVQEWLLFLNSSASVQCSYSGQRDKTDCFTFPPTVFLMLSQVEVICMQVKIYAFFFTVLTCNQQGMLFKKYQFSHFKCKKRR